jgi:hypothetical protein
VKASKPFHLAAETLSDEQCLAFLKDHDSTVGSTPPDNYQFTLLHSIACAKKPRSLQWTLDNVQEARRWQSSSDVQGFTPIEALKDMLENNRATILDAFSTFVVSGIFHGYRPEAVRCLELLSMRERICQHLSSND